MSCPNCGRYSKKERIWEGIEEVLPLFINLNEKINRIKEDLYGKNIPRNDQRVETIDALGYVIFWAVIQLELFIPNFETKNAPGTKHILSTNTMSDKKLFDLIAKFDTMNRMSFLTLFLFQVEVFLKSINSTLENKIRRKGYKNLISHVFKELEISDPNREKYNTLFLPSYARNCLHSGGVHTDNDDNGKINGIKFKFVKNEILYYTGWHHEYFFCDNIVDVLEELFNLEKLKEVTLPSRKEGIA